MPTIYVCDMCGNVVDDVKNLESVTICFSSYDNLQNMGEDREYEACAYCRIKINNLFEYTNLDKLHVVKDHD